MKSPHYIMDSWQGIERESNKDDILIQREGSKHLFVVFDGVSSSTDARAVINVVKNEIGDRFEHLASRDLSLAELFYAANKEVLVRDIPDGASTFVALFIDYDDGFCAISALGDSRIYEITKSHMKLLTQDDSLQGDQSVLTKGLGFENMKRNDFQYQQINISKKRLLLCSDGFYNFQEEDARQLSNTVSLSNLKDVKKKIYHIIFGKNADDATYILVDV